jgi:hypothetical protein
LGEAAALFLGKIMFIVMKDGPKKGEIQEMKFAVARDLINVGRAEQYFFESNVAAKAPSYSGVSEVLQPVAAPISAVEVDKSKKKKGKK